MIWENPLDKKVFQDELDFNTLENILETLDHVTPKKISRQEYNNLKGNFLVETWEDRFWKSYDLYLPDDLKIFELPAIISKVNKITFWEILPDYASKEELKVKITITINTLLQVLSEKILTDEEKKDIQKAIKKYVKLFEDMFWTEESWKLSNENYRNEIIEKSKLSQGYERFKVYQTNLERIKTKEKLSDLLGEIEEKLSWKIIEHFDESFFERWINMLWMWMMTITQAEQEDKERWLIENWYKLEISESWDKTYSKWSEKISFNVKTKTLDKKERLLRNKIWIDYLKRELEGVRKSWNQERINELEIKATNLVLKTIYEYPYQLTQNFFWYKPNKIAEFKEIFCVWFSLLWHAFLSELWIKHYWLDMPAHSALNVIIWWKSYYFDATYQPEITDFLTYLKARRLEDKISYWNPEKILLWQIYWNKWSKIDGEESIKMYDKKIKLNPNDCITYFNKWNRLSDLWRYIEAIEMFDKAVELGLNRTKFSYVLHNNRGSALRELWRYNEALVSYEISLEKNPKQSIVYNNKWILLKTLWKRKISHLYRFAWGTLKNWISYLDSIHREEEWKIKQLIDSQNFEWLRLYLLELEQEED